MRTILTILLTSLFWSFVIMVWFEPRSDQSQSEEMYAETTVVKPNTATTVAQQSGRKSAEKEVARQVSKETPAPAAKQPTTPKPEPQISNKVTEVERKMVEKPSVENVATAELDYVGEIDGKWTPVEGAEFPLEFTKYGTLIQTRYGSLNVRHFYTISSDKRMKIGYNSARFEIVKSGTCQVNNEVLEEWEDTTTANHCHKDTSTLLSVLTEALNCEVEDTTPHN